MMNPSELLTSLKMDLGIYGIALPFDNPDDVLYNTIKLRTLKTFSQYQPYVYEETVDLSEWTPLKKHFSESIYQVPDKFGDLRLIAVNRVSQQNMLTGSGQLNPMFDASITTYQDMMMGQLNADLASATTPAFTFKFAQPNKLHLYNAASYGNRLTIEFFLEHSENLITINNTVWEEFYELALLDVKRMLFNALKHYRELQTAYGTINLQIDDWASAESDRKELISRWKEIFHMDAETIYLI